MKTLRYSVVLILIQTFGTSVFGAPSDHLSTGTSYDLSTLTVSFASPPVITSFTPTTGHTATGVTINGSSFTGTTDVSFNGVSAPFTATTDVKITTNVPVGATTGFITVTNPDGTGSSPTQFVVDNVAPAAPILTATVPPSPSNNPNPAVKGIAEPNSTVQIYLLDNCAGPFIATTHADSGGNFQVIVNVPDNSTTAFTATASDSAGNISVCSAALTYIEDSTPPGPPSCNASSPKSPANNNSPNILGTGEPGSTVTLYTNPACSGSAAGSGRATALGLFSILVNVADNTATIFYGHAEDSAGNVSACSSSGFLYLENSNLPPNSLCGFKYLDINGNGVYEPGLGETGVAGWEVVAIGSPGDTLRTTTDAAGYYCFGGLTDTMYRVFEAGTAGYIQTGGQPYYLLPVADSSQIDSIDFGNFKSGRIEGAKFDDLNGNGGRDTNESGLKDWMICLSPKQVPPRFGFHHVSGAAYVTLNNLPPLPPGFDFMPLTGYIHMGFGNQIGALLPVDGPTAFFKSVVGLSNEVEVTDYKEGGYSSGGIQTHGGVYSSFFDIFVKIEAKGPAGAAYVTRTPVHFTGDLNGPRPGPGTVLRGGPVTMFDKSTGQPGGRLDSLVLTFGNPVSPTDPLCATTDSSGNYHFIDLLPGIYNVREQSQPCWLPTTPVPPTLTVMSGDSITNVDFGNQQGGGKICVTKYYDGNHNQQHDPNEPPMAGVTFNLVGANPVHTYSAITDISGRVCFDGLPLDTYTLTETVPAGYEVIKPKAGFDIFIVTGCEEDSAVWLNAAKYTDSTFRTATPEQWAMALDHSGKRKAVKCKPDKVDFVFNLKYRFGILKMKFPFLTSGEMRVGKNNPTGPVVLSWTDQKEVTFDAQPLNVPGQVLEFTGRGAKGKPVSLTYQWTTPAGGIIDKGSLPLHPSMVDDIIKTNYPRLPMPNLHNVGEDLQKLGKFPITIGASSGPHSVIHFKYADVLKSFVKIAPSGTRFHTDSTHCLDLVNGKQMLRQFKSLPPDIVGGNKLFAEVLALKLNILASEEGRFPQGLADLIYDNSAVDPSPLDSASVDDISMQADTILSCNGNPKGLNLLAIDYYVVVHRINMAFASADADTESWSCSDLALKGVRSPKSVPYLRANPGAIHPTARPSIANWNDTPSAFALKQNYPNPFNPTTTIQFDLDEPARVSLRVYNTLGQEIATLLDEQQMDDGTQEIEFDASGLTSGVYFYSIIVQGAEDPDEGTIGKRFVSVKKMLLIK